MHIPFLRSYSAFSSHQKPTHTSVSSTADLEKNAANDASSTSPTHPHQDYRPPPDPSTLPASLIKFQNLIGISVPPAIRSEQPNRPGQNLGIYKRTVDSENKSKFQYKLSAFLVNMCFMLQIIVGAALTALGAASGPSAAVTILGAVNTILAGLLTYLKGQGLPGRLEQQFQLLRTLREHIEERERDFSELDCILDVDEEVDRIVSMYKEVRQTGRDNAPGTVLAPKGNIATLFKKQESRQDEDVAMPRRNRHSGAKGIMAGLQDVREKYEESHDMAQRQVEEKGKEVRDVEGKIKQVVLGEVDEYKRKAGEEIESLEKGLKNL